MKHLNQTAFFKATLCFIKNNNELDFSKSNLKFCTFLFFFFSADVTSDFSIINYFIIKVFGKSMTWPRQN